MKKKWLCATLAAMMAVSMAGCGTAPSNESTGAAGSTAAETTAAGTTTGAAESEPQTEEAKASGTLNVLLSEEPSDSDPLHVALQTWAEETGNTVEELIIPYDDQTTKFAVMDKQGDVPDIVLSTGLHQAHPEFFVEFDGKNFDTSIFKDNALQLLGQAYASTTVTGLPRNATVTCVYYNKDLFEKAGITVPTDPKEAWSWEQAAENVKKVQAETGVKYGMAVDFSRARYDNFMYSFGGSMVTKNGDAYEVNVNSPESVEALNFFIGLNDDGTMPKAIWANASTDNPSDYFQNGDVAMYCSGTWQYEKYKKNISSFEWGIMTSPVGKEASAISGGSALCIPKKAADQELAFDFLNWFYDEANYQIYANNSKQISTLKNVEYTPDAEADVENQKIFSSEYDKCADAYIQDELSGWRNYTEDGYRTNMSRAVAGEMTAQEALDDFAKQLSEASGWAMKY
ncbi:MAG: sugar ABC transporter substrate-binding protein [Lachnospiraceae bacterium]|nr:sugar ABC transporter substrate-binding protein [Lachnospiraceae bacterium]